MATIIPSGFAQASIEYTGPVGTEPYVCTFGVNLEGATLDQWQEQANDIFTKWATAWADYTSESLTIQRCRLTVALGDDVGSVVSNVPPVDGEVGGGDRVPTAMALIAVKRTAGLGRSNVGRCFIPGVLTDGAVSESGIIASGTLETYTLVWNTFVQALKVAGTEAPATPMVLLHSKPSLPTPVLTGVCQEKVGWVRKRIR